MGAAVCARVTWNKSRRRRPTPLQGARGDLPRGVKAGLLSTKFNMGEGVNRVPSKLAAAAAQHLGPGRWPPSRRGVCVTGRTHARPPGPMRRVQGKRPRLRIRRLHARRRRAPTRTPTQSKAGRNGRRSSGFCSPRRCTGGYSGAVRHGALEAEADAEVVRSASRPWPRPASGGS